MYSPQEPLSPRENKKLKYLLHSGALWRGRSKEHSQPPENFASLGISQIDAKLLGGGLAYGGIHEWYAQHNLSTHDKRYWTAPLVIICAILRHNIRHNFYSYASASDNQVSIWIGRRCWPTPALIERFFGDTAWHLQKQFLFLNPSSASKQLLAIIEALRFPNVAFVVSDGSSISATASRRLHLAARNSNALTFIARPSWQLPLPSAVHTKWSVSNARSPTTFPHWQLELVRARGSLTPLSWTVAYTNKSLNNSNENDSLYIPSDVVNRASALSKRSATA